MCNEQRQPVVTMHYNKMLSAEYKVLYANQLHWRQKSRKQRYCGSCCQQDLLLSAPEMQTSHTQND